VPPVTRTLAPPAAAVMEDTGCLCQLSGPLLGYGKVHYTCPLICGDYSDQSMNAALQQTPAHAPTPRKCCLLTVHSPQQTVVVSDLVGK